MRGETIVHGEKRQMATQPEEGFSRREAARERRARLNQAETVNTEISGRPGASSRPARNSYAEKDDYIGDDMARRAVARRDHEDQQRRLHSPHETGTLALPQGARLEQMIAQDRAVHAYIESRSFGVNYGDPVKKRAPRRGRR